VTVTVSMSPVRTAYEPLPTASTIVTFGRLRLAATARADLPRVVTCDKRLIWPEHRSMDEPSWQATASDSTAPEVEAEMSDAPQTGETLSARARGARLNAAARRHLPRRPLILHTCDAAAVELDSRHDVRSRRGRHRLADTASRVDSLPASALPSVRSSRMDR
jgi:hypothetical protein